MNDENPKKKSLSEISHLFLSSVRDNATGGARPKRLPPGSPRTDLNMELTPEEFAHVLGPAETGSEKPTVGPVTAVIASHLNGKAFDRVKDYARHLAAGGQRIGLIEVDASEFRVMCFDLGTADAQPTEPLETFDARQMSESLEELAWDIDRWLLLLPNPRPPEARQLLREVDRWTLLSTCDHDGVVSCYRSIKGLAEGHRPRLSLALLGASDQAEAARVHRKIASVCQQFLNWPMEAESAVEPAEEVVEHLVLLCRPSRDKASVANSPQWQIVADFLARARANDLAGGAELNKPIVETSEVEVPVSESKFIADVVVPGERSAEPVQPTTASTSPRPAAVETATEDDSEITDLGSGEATEETVLGAVLKKQSLGLVGCPIHPPMCPQAVLAVNRERRLVVLAVARQGLTELRAIGQAYRWVIENRPLLAMAMPQFSIDTHAMPCLRLLVDRADLGAGLLQPMLESGNVTVQTYRKLKWGGKTGLLLEAA